ncbi:RNF213 [Mytilus edulis]|uniref:RNF213 n=1 Tax=Mytilus edulis TaxID=6550 RepID=A0A8S3SRN5_MYTED|nr:RNF213 [Mytilus edulis]
MHFFLSGTEVNRHLEQYFRRALRVCAPFHEVNTIPLDMCLLVIQCMEDSCHQQYSDENPEQILAAMEMLKNDSTNIQYTDTFIENMAHLSRTRFSLSIAAKFMYKVFVEKSVTFDKRLKRLFESVDRICAECGWVWPKLFFVKNICRCYGIDSYQTIRRNCDLTVKPWINLPGLVKDRTEACCDRFIVLGIQYCQMRETFVRAALNTDAHQLENLLQVQNFLQKTLMNSKAVKDKDCYFPTMPQDDLYEVKKAVLAAREEDSLENPVFKSKGSFIGQIEVLKDFELFKIYIDHILCK